MTNPIGLLLPQLQNLLAPRIAEKLGVDEALVRQGMAIAIPLLISALARNTASADGAQSLSSALARDHDGTAVQNPAVAMEQYASGEGSAILSHIFGDRRASVEQAITSGAGVDGSALLQMLAPAVMGALGLAQRQQGLDAGGVADLIQGEQQQMAQRDGDVMDLASKMLDSNRDGSMLDDVLGMLGRLFGRS